MLVTGNPYMSSAAVGNKVTVGALVLNTFYKYNGIDDYRQYVFSKLTKPLIAGKQYMLRFTVASAFHNPDSANIQMSRLGVCLLNSDSVLLQSTGYNQPITNVIPLLETDSTYILNDTGITFLQPFIGNGEKYILIGCFRDKSQLLFSDTTQSDFSATYIFDNFAIYGDSCTDPYSLLLNYTDLMVCRGDSMQLFVTGNLQEKFNWYANGVLLQDTTSHITYPVYANTIISVTQGTGTCFDSTSCNFTVKYLNTNVVADTALFCLQPMHLTASLQGNVPIYQITDYGWQDLAGQQIATMDTNLVITSPGTYIFEANNSNSCFFRDTVIIEPIPALLDTNIYGATVPVFSMRNVSCPGLSDGYIEQAFSDYQVLLHYEWQGPINSGNSGLYSLPGGNYTLLVYDDSLHCETYSTTIVELTDSCAIIAGNIINDRNYNCINNFSDTAMANVVVTAAPYGRMALSDVYGNYELYVPVGNHVVSQTTFPSPSFAPECGNSINISAPSPGSSFYGINFLDTAYFTFNEPQINYLDNTGMRIGTASSYVLDVSNNGNMASNGNVFFVLSDSLQYVSSTPAATLSNDTLIWSFNLGAYQKQAFSVSCNIPAGISLGSAITSCAWIEPLNGDTNLLNNQLCNTMQAVSSYDPNNKLVSPSGIGQQGAIDTTVSEFYYTINFQNTGNATALYIAVEDTISTNLDLSTLKVLSTSHYCLIRILNNNRVVFAFYNINLPDSNTNEPLSHGYITYSIKKKQGLTYGDFITNTAYIFFDNNTVVTTNTTLSTFAQPLHASSLVSWNDGFDVYPNPVHDKLNLLFTRPGQYLISVTDVTGRTLIAARINSDKNTGMPISSLANGVYLVEAKSSDGKKIIKKIVKK